MRLATVHRQPTAQAQLVTGMTAHRPNLQPSRSAVLADIKPEQPPVLLTANLGATPVGRLVPKQRKRR